MINDDDYVDVMVIMLEYDNGDGGECLTLFRCFVRSVRKCFYGYDVRDGEW